MLEVHLEIAAFLLHFTPNRFLHQLGIREIQVP